MKRQLGTASAIALVLVLMVGAGWWIAKAIDPRHDATDIAGMREETARITGRGFLDEYVEPDGRVVRRDEGGDVVSEGQAYGMLIAVAVGDETRFRSIWKWTRTHLRRADGLLAWRWADDTVTDVNSAADADLDAARSLVLAGRRFNAPDLAKDGRRLGVAILQSETVAVGTGAAPPSDVNPQGTWVAGSGRVLVAGNWLRRRRTSSTRGTSVRAPNRNSTRHQPTGGGRASLAPQRVLGWQLIGNRDAAARLGHRDLSRPCHSHRTRQRRSPHTLRSRRRAPTSPVRRILRSRGPSPRGCDAPRPHCAG